MVCNGRVMLADPAMDLQEEDTDAARKSDIAALGLMVVGCLANSEATIDLHGLTRTEAHRALNAFLEGAQEAGRRSVLVITGKGSRGEGVLRDSVPHWLNAEPNRRMIRAFSHAAPKDGGQGALYVLLKRRK